MHTTSNSTITTTTIAIVPVPASKGPVVTCSAAMQSPLVGPRHPLVQVAWQGKQELLVRLA